jgi:hypothetical protein
MAIHHPNRSETHTGVKLPVLEREKLILNGRSYHWITERICGVLKTSSRCSGGCCSSRPR